MQKDVLNVLADAISDVGAWQWWFTENDLFQLEFRDVQLYDEAKAERDAHTLDVLAVRFTGSSFAVFLDNYVDEAERNWPERMRNDELSPFDIDTYTLAFDETEEAVKLFESYANKTVVKDYSGFDAVRSARHIISGSCGDVAFVAGGDELAVVGKKGRFTEEEIVTASKKWWAYWRDYWLSRKTKQAYEKDYACEVTIPADTGHPTGNWLEEDREHAPK